MRITRHPLHDGSPTNGLDARLNGDPGACMPLRIAYAYVEVLVGITTEPPIARAIPPV